MCNYSFSCRGTVYLRQYIPIRREGVASHRREMSLGWRTMATSALCNSGNRFSKFCNRSKPGKVLQVKRSHRLGAFYEIGGVLKLFWLSYETPRQVFVFESSYCSELKALLNIEPVRSAASFHVLKIFVTFNNKHYHVSFDRPKSMSHVQRELRKRNR